MPSRAAEPWADNAMLEELMSLIKQHDAVGYVSALQQRLSREGLRLKADYFEDQVSLDEASQAFDVAQALVQAALGAPPR